MMWIGIVSLILVVSFAIMITVFVYAVKIYEEAVDKAPLIAKKACLEKDIESAQNTLSDIKAQMQSKEAELANANQTIAEGKTERGWLEQNRDTVSSMRNAIAIAKQDLQHVTDELNTRQDELKQKNIEFQEVTGKVQQKSLEDERLNAEITEKSKRVSDLQDKIAQFEAEETNQRKLLEQLREERRDADIGLHKVQDETQYLQTALAQTKEELKKLTAELEQKKAEAIRVAQESLSLREEKQVLLNENDALQKRKQRLEKEVTDSSKQTEALKSEETNLRNTLDGLNRKRLELEREVNQRSGENEQLENVSKELKTTKDQLKKLKQEIAEGVIERDQLSEVISGIKTKLSPGKFQWEDLNREVPFIYKGEKQNRESEQDWLDKFKVNLDQAGIRFNERMINAFHTGLKVADYSPLVVLAGISGTGKSLLPRLYARAIGMNFLQVAVQPRWDGPQDMFGFYNYMEGRYKATELSRFLWQFDCYNNDNAKEKYKDKNLPMNLVLLDEMNLARVEYYFSDLLSKLEVRRGLNLGASDKNQRLNAEIELECGASENNTATRRLFVGSNFLFVGTMNEDETTQTLSDKVVDRSNVLRFGRPQELNAAPNIQKFYDQFSERSICQQHWKNWIVSEDAERIKKLQKIMDSINEQLELLGRPFAHRVWQAMKTYVSNYPIEGEQGFRYAVADQIEMKILPKLNGLEKASSAMPQVLNTISSEISDLKDDALLEAFDTVRNNDDPFFQWRGIMR